MHLLISVKLAAREAGRGAGPAEPGPRARAALLLTATLLPAAGSADFATPGWHAIHLSRWTFRVLRQRVAGPRETLPL
jgi:hypothetical protein